MQNRLNSVDHHGRASHYTESLLLFFWLFGAKIAPEKIIWLKNGRKMPKKFG